MHLFRNVLIALMLFNQSGLAVAATRVDDEGERSIATESILVESFNLRYDTSQDGINAWPYRQGMVLNHLQLTQPDVVGVQEALAHQLECLEKQLPHYNAIGAGRNDGKRSGEFVPLLYNTQTMTILDSGHFWLSETPNVAGSIGWSAKHPRMVTWGKFTKNDQDFFIFNTHFSHVSELARVKSAEFLVNHIPTIAGDSPVVLMGDFNALEAGPAYMTLTADTGLMLTDTALVDNDAPADTFNHFGQSASKRIDYIFISNGLGSSSYLTHQIREGERYISDHYPISTQVFFNEPEQTL